MANEDINVGAISEALNNKVDLNQMNTNAQGLSYASGWSMPSGRYIDLTLGASGTDYTAPANGWFTLLRQSGRTDFNPYVRLWNTKNGLGTEVRNGTGIMTNHVSVKASKGDVIRYSGDATGEVLYFRFIYAQGEQN